MMQVQPYLFFDGRCEEALTFYKSAIGAEVIAMMRFSDNPEPMPSGMCAPGSENKIMHSAFTIGESLLMASDGRALNKPNFEGVSLSLTASNDEEARRLFTALADGGKIQMPLGETFYATSFGMVADQFGVPWMVIAPKTP